MPPTTGESADRTLAKSSPSSGSSWGKSWGRSLDNTSATCGYLVAAREELPVSTVSMSWLSGVGSVDGIRIPMAWSIAAVAAVVSEVEVKGSWIGSIETNWSFGWGRLWGRMLANCFDNVWIMSARSVASFCLSCRAWFHRAQSSAKAEVRCHKVPNISAICSLSVLDWSVCISIGRVCLLCGGRCSVTPCVGVPEDLGIGMDVVWVK